jgi:hypothetical protein
MLRAILSSPGRNRIPDPDRGTMSQLPGVQCTALRWRRPPGMDAPRRNVRPTEHNQYNSRYAQD